MQHLGGGKGLNPELSHHELLTSPPLHHHQDLLNPAQHHHQQPSHHELLPSPPLHHHQDLLTPAQHYHQHPGGDSGVGLNPEPPTTSSYPVLPCTTIRTCSPLPNTTISTQEERQEVDLILN